LSVVSGQLKVENGSTVTSAANQTINTVAGRWYRFDYYVDPQTSGNPVIRVRDAVALTVLQTNTRTTAGNYTVYFSAIGSTTQVQALNSASTLGVFFTIDNISVRELPGNHAFTPAAASTARPTVSARVNGLVATEDLTSASWTKGSGVSATATTLTFTTGGATQFVRQPVVFTSGITYKILVRARSISGNTSLSLDLENAQTNAFTLTSALQNFEWVVLASGNRAWLDIQLGGAGSIEITAIDVRVANDGVGIPNYQRVNTATDYDVSGFPVYLRADGSNDFLQTNSIDFTGTDKMTLCAGVRKLSDAATGMVFELSAISSTTDGTFSLRGPSGAGVNSFEFTSRGTTLRSADTLSGYVAPITGVLTGIGNISGDSAILRVNGVQAASNTGDQGTGNYGNYVLNLFSRNQASLFFNGRFYGGVGRGAQSNDQQIAALEGYMNTKTAAY
jgi:hypothetical protein